MSRFGRFFGGRDVGAGAGGDDDEEQRARQVRLARSKRAERPRAAAPAGGLSISRMLEAGRPSGRLPALQSGTNPRSGYAARWKKIVGGTPGAPREVKPIYEPSRYTESDDREDEDQG
jgi:hypothetical protein